MTQKATFAAGCFWGVESAFRAIPGVTATRVGYTGGHTDNPTYYDVCSDTTGHAEAVEVEFDPEQVTYERCSTSSGARTTRPRGTARVRTSAASTAPPCSSTRPSRRSRRSPHVRASRRSCRARVTTEVVPAGEFHEAEDYHQQYFEKQGRTSCHAGLRAAAAS